jgi:hypothetical protein
MILKKYQLPTLLIFIILILALVIMYIICSSLDAASRLSIKIEIFRIIANGLVISFIAIWIKYLLDESAKLREREKAKQVAERVLFSGLTAALNGALSTLKSGTTGVSNFSAIFSSPVSEDQKQYDKLLFYWKALEPKAPVQRAISEYRELEDYYNKVKFSADFRKIAEQKVHEW